MAILDIETIFALLAYGVSSQKPSISEPIPTVADLEARVRELHASERTKGEVREEPPAPAAAPGKASSIASVCIPCSVGHLSTCSGLLNEAMRFARKDGIASEEVINRVGMCMDELNSLERVDLRPEMTVGLPDWEKPLAEQALDLSRSLRHDLEGISTVSQLESIAAKTQTKRQEIGKAWFKERFSRMTPEQQQLVEAKLREKAAAVG